MTRSGWSGKAVEFPERADQGVAAARAGGGEGGAADRLPEGPRGEFVVGVLAERRHVGEVGRGFAGEFELVVPAADPAGPVVGLDLQPLGGRLAEDVEQLAGGGEGLARLRNEEAVDREPGPEFEVGGQETAPAPGGGRSWYSLTFFPRYPGPWTPDCTTTRRRVRKANRSPRRKGIGTLPSR